MKVPNLCVQRKQKAHIKTSSLHFGFLKLLTYLLGFLYPISPLSTPPLQAGLCSTRYAGRPNPQSKRRAYLVRCTGLVVGPPALA